MTGSSTEDPGYGSVADEIAALAEALKSRRPRGGGATAGDPRARPDSSEDPPAEHLDVCGICPLCRAVSALHTVSPNAVSALADLAHQAEVVLRVIASDLAQQRQESAAPPEREDIPVDDLE